MDSQFLPLYLLISPSKKKAFSYLPSIYASLNGQSICLDERGNRTGQHVVICDSLLDVYIAWISLHENASESVAQKAFVLGQLLKLFDQKTVSRNCSSLLDIPSVDRVFKQFKDVSGLPKAFLKFSHDKQLNLKQLLTFVAYRDTLILEVLQLSTLIQLSQSNFILILDQLSDYCQLHDITAKDFFEKKDIRKILESEDPIAVRTKRFKTHLHSLRNPMISGINKKIDNLVSDLDLQKNTKLEWDRSLETPGFILSVSISCREDLVSAFSQLADKNTEQKLTHLLESL